jgi:cellulose synthase/poly-beta-1,6-N-acetylglucosamine synthase-like glycosyltransferase
MRALVDVGFWQNDIVTEDSRIFLQCFIHYDGNYEVTPMYIPVSMDTAYAGTFAQTAKNLYKQQRRWAWGSEHFPFMIWHFWKANLGPRKWHLVTNLAEGMYSWATAPILIMVLGYLPLYLAADVEKATVIAQNAPYVLQWLMRITMIGIFTSAILNVYLLPSTIPGNRFMKILVMMLQWILLPVVLIVFGSIPAIDAQTRLMLGKYLGFYTAKKVRAHSQDVNVS